MRRRAASGQRDRGVRRSWRHYVRNAVSQGPAGRSSAGQRSHDHRVRTPVLVLVCVLIAATLMAALTAKALASRTSCAAKVVVHVAASADIAPAVGRIAAAFNRQHRQASGHCAQVQVTSAQPATVASDIDGQGASGGLPALDAWIPDSSTWVDVVRGYPMGARRAQPTGIDVAESPLMIVMPAAAAAQMPGFNSSIGWRFLLPSSIGGPSYSLHLRVDLPDPSQSAVGLAALVQMSRFIGTRDPRSHLTRFVFNAEATPEFESPTELAAFVDQSRPPLFGRPVTVATEQAVLQYDQANPGQPLAARYPVGAGPASGTPELDYPYVLTTSNPLELAAARAFGQELRSSYAAAVVRYFGFRSANGVPDRMPAGDGLGGQVLRLAPPASAAEVQTALQAWQRLSLGSNDLALMDVSKAMADPGGPGGETLEEELSQSAGLGLALFPDSTHLGLWEFADNLSNGQPYKQLVSVGPLPGHVGLITRRQQLEEIDATLKTATRSPAALYSAVLAGYKHMLADYQPDDVNAVLLLTAGLDNAPGGPSLTSLLSQLHALFNPSHPVEIVVVMLGTAGNFAAMQQIADVTDGRAYEITNPADIGRVFFTAIAHRICPTRCAVT
jgi:Bacterial extracellular solute-binding protein